MVAMIATTVLVESLRSGVLSSHYEDMPQQRLLLYTVAA
jgi:hypothetical protein